MKTVFLLWFFCFFALSENLEKPSSAVKSIHKDAKNSQQKINLLDDETKKLLQKYRSALSKTDNLRIYNKQLSSYIEGQKKEILDIRKKIEEVKDTGQDIEPLMLRMLASLGHFVDLDIPFLLPERKSRLQNLKKTLNRSDVSVGEKYRQLILAYKRELDYGRTLQSYKGVKKIKGQSLTVEYLRLGRLSFIYKSLDGRHLAYWDKKKGEWKKLPKSYKKDVIKAIKISLKRIPPDLIKLPILSPISQGANL